MKQFVFDSDEEVNNKPILSRLGYKKNAMFSDDHKFNNKKSQLKSNKTQFWFKGKSFDNINEIRNEQDDNDYNNHNYQSKINPRFHKRNFKQQENPSNYCSNFNKRRQLKRNQSIPNLNKNFNHDNQFEVQKNEDNDEYYQHIERTNAGSYLKQLKKPPFNNEKFKKHQKQRRSISDEINYQDNTQVNEYPHNNEISGEDISSFIRFKQKMGNKKKRRNTNYNDEKTDTFIKQSSKQFGQKRATFVDEGELHSLDSESQITTKNLKSRSFETEILSDNFDPSIYSMNIQKKERNIDTDAIHDGLNENRDQIYMVFKDANGELQKFDLNQLPDSLKLQFVNYLQNPNEAQNILTNMPYNQVDTQSRHDQSGKRIPENENIKNPTCNKPNITPLAEGFNDPFSKNVINKEYERKNLKMDICPPFYSKIRYTPRIISSKTCCTKNEFFNRNFRRVEKSKKLTMRNFSTWSKNRYLERNIFKKRIKNVNFIIKNILMNNKMNLLVNPKYNVTQSIMGPLNKKISFDHEHEFKQAENTQIQNKNISTSQRSNLQNQQQKAHKFDINERDYHTNYRLQKPDIITENSDERVVQTFLDLTDADDEKLKNLKSVEVFNSTRTDRGKLSAMMNSQWKLYLYRTLGVPLKRI